MKNSGVFNKTVENIGLKQKKRVGSEKLGPGWVEPVQIYGSWVWLRQIKSGDVIQSSEKTSNLFLCFWSRHFSDGSDFIGIYFNTLLTDNKAQELSGSNTEGTLVRVQTELILSQPSKHLQ